MITFINSVFENQAADRKAQVAGLALKGAEDVLIQGCTFKNKGYEAILNQSTGKVVIENCTFECNNMYNPIEGAQSVNNGNVIVKNCKFTGVPGNNYINFYQFADGSKHEIIGCSFTPSVDTNIIRISNRTSAKAEFVVKDCEYTYGAGDPTDYTNFLLCQDYTAKNGVAQDFTGVSVVLDNLVCDGEKVVEKPVKGGIFYVYEDGKGLITGGDNDPVVVVK